MKRNLVIFCLAGLVTANAGAAENKELINGESGVTASISLGQLSEAWTTKNSDQNKSKVNFTVPIIKGDIAWDATDQLTLNARGYTTLSSSKAKQRELLHIRSEYAREFDLNLKAWVVKEPNYRFGGVLGYQQTRTRLLVSPDSKFASSRSNVNRRFSLPYLGLAGMYRYQDFELNALAKYSPWVKGQERIDFNDPDTARLTRNSYNSKYYSATVNAGYYITPNTKLFAEVDWAKVNPSNKKAEDVKASQIAGFAHHSVSVGLEYRF
jgi:plasminogen activator